MPESGKRGLPDRCSSRDLTYTLELQLTTTVCLGPESPGTHASPGFAQELELLYFFLCRIRGCTKRDVGKGKAILHKKSRLHKKPPRREKRRRGKGVKSPPPTLMWRHRSTGKGGTAIPFSFAYYSLGGSRHRPQGDAGRRSGYERKTGVWEACLSCL